MSIDLICLGRTTIDLFSQDTGEPYEHISGFSAYVGGTPLNIAVAAQRLGMNSALLTGTSNDGVGRFVRHFLQQEGISTEYMHLKEGRYTNAFFLSIQPPDTFESVSYQHNMADLFLSIEDVTQAPISQAKAVLITGIGLSGRESHGANLTTAESASENGVSVYMDIDYKSTQWEDVRQFGIFVRTALPLVDVAIGTELEVCAAAGRDDPHEAALRLLSLVREGIILKKGSRGATFYGKGGDVFKAPVFPVEVLNVFGAGDAFAAGVIYARGTGQSWEESLRLAAACGAIIVTRRGCANDMPTLDDVTAFLQAR